MDLKKESQSPKSVPPKVRHMITSTSISESLNNQYALTSEALTNFEGAVKQYQNVFMKSDRCSAAPHLQVRIAASVANETCWR